MTNEPLVQVDFSSPDGRRERLWAEVVGENKVRILSVPVWTYGVSMGAIVLTGAMHPSVVHVSDGATIRFLVAAGTTGKQVYLTRIVPDLSKLKLGVGPATFYGPRLVALHIHRRATWWPEIGGYLDSLIGNGTLEQWEAGDPDQGAEAHDELGEAPSSERLLVHPLPVNGESDSELS